MKTMLTLATCGVLFGWTSPIRADDKVDPRSELTTAVDEAIRLLDAKEYEKFLEAFVAPEDLKKLTKKAPLPEFAKQFGGRKADRLLAALNEAKEVKPTMGEDGKRATYAVKSGPGMKLVFDKIDKYWYIRN